MGKVEHLLYDVLNGQLIDAVVDVVGAEDIDAAFVEPVGPQRPTAVERDVVVGRLVHDDAQRSVGRGVDEEADVDVSGNVGAVVIGLLHRAEAVDVQ